MPSRKLAAILSANVAARGFGDDRGPGIAVDSLGQTYVTGQTNA